VVAREAHASEQAEARDTEGTRTGYGGPVGESLLGDLVAASSATVTLGPELQRAVDQLVRDVAGDVIKIVEEIANDLAKGARADWYKNVRRKSGESGNSNDYRMELRGTSVRGIVYNGATKNLPRREKFNGAPGGTVKVYGPTEYGYFVRRPGPFSRIFVGLNFTEYSTVMSYWRANGRLPDGYIARAMQDAKGKERPIGISKETDNPFHADGKNLWKVLVIDRKKAAIEARLDDLDKALQASAARF
jgi:hypothetical protein